MNDIGYGDYSTDLIAAMTAPPSVPSGLTQDFLASTQTSVAFSWVSVNDNDGL